MNVQYYKISISTTLHTGNNLLNSPRTPCRHCPTISRNDFQQLPPLRGQLSVCCVASRRGEKVALFRGRRCHRCCCCLLLALPRRSRRCRRWHKTCEASAQRSHLAGERAAKRTAKAKRKLSGETGKQWEKEMSQTDCRLAITQSWYLVIKNKGGSRQRARICFYSAVHFVWSSTQFQVE